MKADSISIMALAGILCGCAATTPKMHKSAQGEVTPYKELTTSLPSWLTLPLSDSLEVTPGVANSINWQQPSAHVIKVHRPSYNPAPNSLRIIGPQTGYRPEYLIETRYQPPIDLKDLER
jgi:hypothetical protein